MRVLRGLTCAKVPTAVTIGNFDGMHLGHQLLLQEFKQFAAKYNLPTLVVIFEPQPKEFSAPHSSPARLFRLRDKLSYLQNLGVDFVCCLHFNINLANLSAVDFVQKILFKQVAAKMIFVGQDFRFGHERLGDINLLTNLCQQESVLLHICVDVTLNNATRISSTLVRSALFDADFLKVKQLLDREYSMRGRVSHGASIGRKFDVPTVNIATYPGKLALYGVYVVRVLVKTKSFYGVANIGCRPTLDLKQVKNVLEVHIFDFNDNLYGQKIEVFFLHKLRDEKKYASLELLFAQIKLDIAASRRYLSQYTNLL